jgi:putative holliday junction resolvase
MITIKNPTSQKFFERLFDVNFTFNTIIALDIGGKRIGTAIFSEKEFKPVPFKTLNSEKGSLKKQLLNLLEELEIKLIVVGVPLTSQNELTAKAFTTVKEVEKIAKRCNLSLVFVDEYLSTVEALERLGRKNFTDVRDLKKLGKLDSLSATIIFERFLFERKR